MESFFTFPDRSLKYDCPSCGSQCCKGKGLALEAREEVVRFARIEPRLSALLYPMNARFAQVLDLTDGCWLLRPDGLCSIETDRSYAEKPQTCRLFPFNRVFTIGQSRVVDFNSKICPLQDVADERNGQSWADLQKQIDGEGEAYFGRGEVPPPPGGEELSWLSHEAFVRDAIDAHLDQPDYAAFAALQEEAVLSLLRKQSMPEPGSERVQARAQMMRKLLHRWRVHHGVADDAQLEEASRRAARQVALLTCSWRLNVLLRRDSPPYGMEIQQVPKRLLATSHLIELAQLARRSPPGLRAATETFKNAAPLIAVLAFFPRRVRLKEPLQNDFAVASEVKPALRALSQALLEGSRSLADSAEISLRDYAPPLRSMAVSALAFGDAELLVE